MGDEEGVRTPSPKKRDALQLVTGTNFVEGSEPDSRRRKFLGTAVGVIGGTVALIRGLSTPVTADRPSHADVAVAAAREFASERKAREAIQSLAAEQLAELAKQGHVTDGSASAFPLEDVKPVKEYVESAEGTYVAATALRANHG